MTRGITNMLNLPSLEDALAKNTDPAQPDPKIEEPDDSTAMLTTALSMMENKIADAGGEDHSRSMDGLYDEALKHSRDLADLGFNVDHARARGMFEQAANFLKIALDAKNSKRDAQLKALKLVLDQRRVEIEEKRARAELGESANNPGEATVVVEDRNDLIRRFRNQLKGE
jgi:hypothetical protein